METVLLGKTGRRVSRLGFGGAPAGLKNYLESYDPSRADDRDGVLAAVERALALGVTYFDTAAAYGDGASETIFGEGLAATDPNRVFVATKMGAWSDEPVRPALERSLTRLRRDRIDLLQFHGSSYPPEQLERIFRPGGMLEQLQALRDEGLIAHLGFTCEAHDEGLYRLIRSEAFEVAQICYNFIFQHPCDPDRKSGCFYDLEARGMGIVTMRGTTSGTFQRWIRMVNPENTFDYTPALIRFQFSNPLIDVVLVGMRRPEEVEANVALCEDRAGRIDLDELHRRYV